MSTTEHTKRTKALFTQGVPRLVRGSSSRGQRLARRSFLQPHPVLSCVSCISWFFLVLLMLWPGGVAGSPSSALREYKAGQYEAALKEYQRLLERKADDPRLRFNAGTAAYRNRQFEEATKQFEEALASPLTSSNLKLQELAYYNRGNSLYHLGENVPDPAKKTETWQKSLKDFENSLKLNPQDADAKFNYEFVKKRLEELKQQQQQQQKQDKNDQQQDQDQNQQQQQQQDQQSKQDQNQKQQEQQQSQSEQKQDSSPQKQQQAQQPKPEGQKQQQQQGAKQSEDQKKQEQQASQSAAESKEKPDQKEGQAASYAAGQMTPEQAQQLLDAQKGDEQMLPIKPEGKPVDRTRPFKDW